MHVSPGGHATTHAPIDRHLGKTQHVPCTHSPEVPSGSVQSFPVSPAKTHVPSVEQRSAVHSSSSLHWMSSTHSGIPELVEPAEVPPACPPPPWPASQSGPITITRPPQAAINSVAKSAYRNFLIIISLRLVRVDCTTFRHYNYVMAENVVRLTVFLVALSISCARVEVDCPCEGQGGMGGSSIGDAGSDADAAVMTCTAGFCLSGEACVPHCPFGGVCIEGVCSPCTSSDQCDDANPCTSDKCQGSACKHIPNNTVICVDGLGNDGICSEGSCCAFPFCVSANGCANPCPPGQTCSATHFCQ